MKTLILIVMFALTLPVVAKDDVRRDLDKGDQRRVRSEVLQQDQHNPLLQWFIEVFGRTLTPVHPKKEL